MQGLEIGKDLAEEEPEDEKGIAQVQNLEVSPLHMVQTLQGGKAIIQVRDVKLEQAMAQVCSLKARDSTAAELRGGEVAQGQSIKTRKTLAQEWSREGGTHLHKR